MSNLVRAKHPNGGEFTTSEAHAKRNGLTYTDKDAVDQWGRIIPAKPATNLAGEAVDPDRNSRSELEGTARAAGLDKAAISAAKTKADLSAAITAASEEVTR